MFFQTIGFMCFRKFMSSLKRDDLGISSSSKLDEIKQKDFQVWDSLVNDRRKSKK